MLLLDLLYIIAFLLSLPLWIKFLFKKEYRKILKYRLSPAITPGKQKRIWIHAVSVGEVRSLKHLIDQLKKTYKNIEIVLTVTTPTGFKTTQELYTDIRTINAPLDFSFTIKRFIKSINPHILVLNELEIWPNWVSITHRQKIPILLINGRMSEPAFQRYKKFTFLVKHFFRKIHRFLVQADIYKQRFRQLGIPEEKITVCGNIKADEACKSVERLPQDSEILDYLGLNPHGKTIVTLASSHRKDEELVVPVIDKLGKDFQFIIVPRHLTRVEEIERLLEKHRVEYYTWSKRKHENEAHNPDRNSTDGRAKVLIFDTMGYLFNVLKVSDIVFMGGTMDPKTGGHNLYEPAVLGKYIMGGPYYNNFPDIGAELVNRGVYNIVRDKEECLQRLRDCKTIDRETIKKEAARAVDSRRGSVQCILKEIQRLIPSQQH